MRFITVVPAIRTPFGVDAFDYRLDDESDVRPGDLIRVPFRSHLTPSLVISVSASSPFADKTIGVRDVQPLVRLSASIVPLLERTAAVGFVSRPTVLQSWIRNVPVRADSLPDAPMKPTDHTVDISEYVADRAERVIHHAKKLHGRVLILTPWQRRAETLASQLKARVLHADLAVTTAWSAWTSFVSEPNSILVATRIGAWLSSVADAVVIDEPENDDFKQDELSPRLDARRVVETMNVYRPHLSVIRVGTTPPLSEYDDLPHITVPNIVVPLVCDSWNRQARSDIHGLNVRALELIEEAVAEGRSVVIVHPIRGERARVTCRDCRWTAVCASCGFPISREESGGRCRRCGRKAAIPDVCPTCSSADLNRSRPGRDRLAANLASHVDTSKISVIDLTDWHSAALSPMTRVVVTDISLIGGYAEDVRRRERLVIAWRRLAATVAVAHGDIVAQGPEELLDQARSWLTRDGLLAAWKEEWQDRERFAYPPARQRIKILVDGEPSDGEAVASRLRGAAPSSWEIQGPFSVAFRARTRKPRQAIHILPAADATENDVTDVLLPFAKHAIIDLDPIAFFM